MYCSSPTQILEYIVSFHSFSAQDSANSRSIRSPAQSPSPGQAAPLPPIEDSSSFLTIDEAAQYLRCSTKHIRRQVSAGSLPAVRAQGGRLLFQKIDLSGLLTPVRQIQPPANSPTSPSTETPFQDDKDSWMRELMSQKN